MPRSWLEGLLRSSLPGGPRLSGLGSAIFVLKELTDGNTDVEIKRRKGILQSENDEVGRLVSALTDYKDRLLELDLVREKQLDDKNKRDQLIIEIKWESSSCSVLK